MVMLITLGLVDLRSADVGGIEDRTIATTEQSADAPGPVTPPE